MKDRLETIGETLEKDIKKALDLAYPPSSEPGQSPRKQSGQLQAAIQHETQATREGTATRVGVATSQDAVYAKFLEVGTSRMAPRPFFRLAFQRNLELMKRILGARLTARIALALKE